MTMHEDRGDEADVEMLFAARRGADARPADDFLARMVALAEAAQPPAAVPPVARASRRGLFALVGGWPALGGMLAATVTGFVIGVAPSDGLSTWAAEAAGEVVDIGFYGEEDVLALLEG